MTARLLRSLATMGAAWMLSAGTASAQAPVLSPAAVSGANLTLNWTSTAGATNYRLEAGLAPSAYIAALPIGNVSTFSVAAPGVATYFLRIVAQTPAGELASNEIAAVVTSMAAPPATPTALAVARNGVGIVVTWAPGAGGGAPIGYRLSVDLPTGGTLPVPVAATSFAYAPVPAGNYNFRVAAANAAGFSLDTPNVALTMPAGGACDPPPAPVVTQSVFGGFVTLSWAPIPGAASYQLTGYQNDALLGSIPVGGGTSRVSLQLGQASYRIEVRAAFSCGSQGATGVTTFVIDESSLKMQPREPDPAPGTALGAPPYLRSVVQDIARRFPGDLRNSCHEFGGNNRWLFRLVAELRTIDKRWGLNWKRARVGDMSQDVVTYNFSADPDEGTRKIRAWDVIVGHCGPNPGPNWTEVTDPRPPAFGNNAQWTLQPYIAAGFTP